MKIKMKSMNKHKKHQPPGDDYLPVQFSPSVMSDSLWPHRLQPTRPPCPSPTPRVLNSGSLTRWCHSTMSSSVVPFSSCPQSLPASGVFSSESTLHMRWPKDSRFSFSTRPSNDHPGLWTTHPLGWTGRISLQSKGLSRVFSNNHSSKASILLFLAFFIVQLSHPYTTTGKTTALIRQTFVGKVMSAF